MKSMHAEVLVVLVAVAVLAVMATVMVVNGNGSGNCGKLIRKFKNLGKKKRFSLYFRLVMILNSLMYICF